MVQLIALFSDKVEADDEAVSADTTAKIIEGLLQKVENGLLKKSNKLITWDSILTLDSQREQCPGLGAIVKNNTNSILGIMTKVFF